MKTCRLLYHKKKSIRFNGRHLLALTGIALMNKLQDNFVCFILALTEQKRALEELLYAVWALPVKNDSGEIFAGMMMAQDITGRVRADSEHSQRYHRARACGTWTHL